MAKAKFSFEGLKGFLKNRIAWINRGTSHGYVYYGENNSLPNEIIEALNNSGTATACGNRLKQFVVADGFKDELTGKKPINKTQTLNDLLVDVGENEVDLEAFALQIFFNKGGMVNSMKVIPIPWIRKKEGDQDLFIYNRLMGESNKNPADDVTIKHIDLTEKPSERAARITQETTDNKGVQVGELFYCYRKKLGRNYDLYPIPSYYSGIDDIISDGKISVLELRNIQQGWRTPIIISTGPIDDQNSHIDEDGNATGITDQDLFDDNISNFLGEDAAPVIHLKGRTAEEMPKITTLDIKDLVDMTEKGTIRLGEKVCRLRGVPKVIVGFASAGQLGNVQELKNMMDLFYITIISRQNWITSNMDKLKPIIEGGEQLDFEISKLNALTLIPDAIVARLSEEELRQIFEIPKVEVEVGTNGEPIEIAAESNATLTNLTGRQMQGIQRVVRKFNKDELTYDQAATLLKSGFGFQDQDVDVWLVTKEEEGQEDGDNNIN
jgi:hypothetical protein